MKQLLFFLFLYLSSFLTSFGQTCEVKVEAIRGTYTGGCENNKANGEGKSTGTDEYEGTFKNGYPDGKGIYTWKDGHYFMGTFKKGDKDGKGNMYYESAKGTDSIITGFWKNDKYAGEYEKPYVIISMSSRINRVNCSLMHKKGEDISINVHQLTYSTNYLAAVNNISILNGSYYSQSTQKLTNSTVTRILGVVFPFRAIFTVGGDTTEILFNEKGDYDVNIDIQ